MLLLLVEDDADTRHAYATYFRANGIEVEIAVTGMQALNKALIVAPSAIVLDLVLPEMSGWETIRQLKLRLHTRKIPLLAISGHAWPSERIEASGCDAYLQKPCGPAELLEAVRRLVADPRPLAPTRTRNA
jgi:two-component system, cell cycle response regulator DivK